MLSEPCSLKQSKIFCSTFSESYDISHKFMTFQNENEH